MAESSVETLLVANDMAGPAHAVRPAFASHDSSLSLGDGVALAETCIQHYLSNRCAVISGA